MLEQKLLGLSQKILSSETSSRFGTRFFGETLSECFPKFNWRQTKEVGGNALHFFQTQEDKDSIDLLFYVNVDTNNPSSLSLWTETDLDPLKVTFKKGLLYGLGAAHEKISLVPFLQALTDLMIEDSLKLNVMFVAGYGRDRSMLGAKRAVQEILKDKKVKHVCVGSPTQNKISLSSVGRTKMEIFFPFSESEKEIRIAHDLKENISSQSKIFNYQGGESLDENVIFRALEACSLLPKNTILLDFSGGESSITEAESIYLELDFVPSCQNSLISKLEDLGSLISTLNTNLLGYFASTELKRALHIGRCQTSESGVSFFGFNFIPAGVEYEKLSSWYKDLKQFIQKQGGELRIRDTKKSFMNENSFWKNQKVDFSKEGSLNLTEATFFSRHYKDVVIFGVGEEGVAKKSNESVALKSLVTCYEVFKETHLRLRK